MVDESAVLEQIERDGDEWQRWRARRLAGVSVGEFDVIPYQDDLGAFSGPSGGPSPGGTAEGICHLTILGLANSAPAVIAADWLDEMRTPAGAWLDRPEEVPGVLETTAGARVWATAAAACALLAVGRDPGPRAIALLRTESDTAGHFTGGAYPTFAATAAFWLSEGPKTEIAEWGLRWVRESEEEWWGPWEWATALTFFGAAGIPPDHPTVGSLFDQLLDLPTPDDMGLALRTVELARHYG